MSSNEDEIRTEVQLDVVNNKVDGSEANAAKRVRKRKTRGQKRKEKKAAEQQKGVWPDRREIVRDNENLVSYYKLQPFLKEGEFDEFMVGLRATLPASFRINTFDYGQAKFLRRLVQKPEFCDFMGEEKTEASQNNDEISQVEDGISSETNGNKNCETQEQKPIETALEPLSWYPERMGWQMNITRVDLRKCPVLQQLHKFIMAETDNGFISRQESVSMIPPLLLDIRRGQTVLDMCAAPGSKTAQLLEYLKSDIFGSEEGRSKSQDDCYFDDGLVVANDVDNKRCYMLVHQANRLNSPNCVIINEDAAKLPNMKTFDKDSDEYNIRFDRILCDVPCSGDGTVRKNPDIWRKWTIGNANNFHGVQSKILKRGIELLKKDGLLVYSTCSMNPVEDEAVVASILRTSKGKVVLEDVTNKLSGLKTRPGLSKWTVMNRDMEVISSLEDVKPEYASQIYSSLFPPNEDEINQFKLERCLRILPHLQNTGAFFVAVLRKTCSTMPWEEPKVDAASGVDSKGSQAEPNPKKRRYGGFKENPFRFMTVDDPDWILIRDFYGLTDKFPVNQLATRCLADKKRTLHLVSKKTRSFIIANQEEADRKNFVKIINGGMRLFVKAESEAGFRISQDGVAEIAPYIKSDLKVAATKDDLILLLKSRTVVMDKLSSGAHIRDNLKVGSLILVYKHIEDNEEPLEIPLVAWRGEHGVALYVSNTYRIHLCALVQLRVSEDAANRKKSDQVKVE